MIFGRNRKRDQQESDDAESAETTEADESPDAASTEDVVEADADVSETAADDTAAADDADAGDADAVDTAPAASGPTLDVETLDATEWRTDGPFDVRELHDEAAVPDDDHPRIDLGSLVLTGVPGSELRLQVSEETQEIVSAMLIIETPGTEANGSAGTGPTSSALELSAYAAPRSGGLWTELRDEISESATSGGGSASLAEGPFGVELRRLIPVTTPDGEQGYQPSRMWVAEGPRWLLRGIVYGQAAIEEGVESPSVASVLAAFRAVVVRRGEEAMAPGDLLPMAMPSDLVQPDAVQPE